MQPDGSSSNGYPNLLPFLKDVEQYLRSRRPRQFDIHNLVQETYCRAYATIRCRGPPRNPRPWLITIARRTLANAYRASYRTEQQRGPRSHPTLENLVGTQPDPVVAAAQRETWNTLSRVLDLLQPRDKHLLVEHYLNGTSLRDLSDQLGTTHEVVKTRIYRARCRVRALLEGNQV